MMEHGGRPRILVIDDDDAMSGLLRRVLSTEGDVAVERGARAALDRLARDEHFDLLLCDVHMPEMSGIALYRELRDARPAAADRLVFMTGGGLDPEDEEFLASSPAPTLEKPFTPSALRAAVRALLERPAARRLQGAQ